MDDLQKFQSIQKEGLELFKKKNKDYGDSYKNFKLLGILVRLNDKINRCLNISKTNITLINDETLRDTLIDLQNYSTMSIIEFDKNNKPHKSSINHYTNGL